MGEKGNVTSEELAALAATGGTVTAGPGTQVTAVFEDAASTIKDKVIDKSADAAIEEGRERWHRSRSDDPASDGGSPAS